MDENNIIKKKKNNKNKNYYKRHNNQHKNYYYKPKKKKNLILENNDSEEVKNILLFNEEPDNTSIDSNDLKPNIEELKTIEPIHQNVVKIVENPLPDYDEMDIVPKRKEKKVKKLFSKINYKYGLGLAVFLILILGASYSYFNYTKVDSRQADISSGEVYVKLVENATSITLNKMYPRTDEEARERNDNYFDFTIKAKNTSETKSVLYTININNGENISGKTRIDPKYIRLDLQEKVNNNYVYIKEGVNLDSYDFLGYVPENTTSEITKEYRLRIWINDDILISNTDPNRTHTITEFSNLYANFNISVNSEDKAIAYSMFAKNSDTTALINFANISSSTNGQGLYRLPGTENDPYPIYYYRGAVTNNNVIFGDYCWQMVRTTDTGGIKMIYNGAVTGNGTTCENTAHADRIISSSAFDSQYNTMADVGYMKNNNARYTYTNAAGASGSIYGKKVEWDGTNYLVIDDTANTASSNTAKDNNHHYSCGTAGTTSCESVRYYYYNNYYITLTSGDFVEDAIYKMTGNIVNPNIDVVTRNSGYVLNNTDSTVKTAIESWFRTNLTNEVDNTKINYVNYLEDTVYCNDRSVKTVSGNTNNPTYQESGWNPSGGDLTKYLYFGTNNRVYNSWYSTTNVPSVVCPNETDRFSVSSSVAHLNYPVGLLTADEIVMAGASGNSTTNNTVYYLYTGGNYWSLSPFSFNYYNVFEFYVNNRGRLDYYDVYNSYGVRPVVSLKPGTGFESGGDGTPTNPYIVKYE